MSTFTKAELRMIAAIRKRGGGFLEPFTDEQVLNAYAALFDHFPAVHEDEWPIDL